jgi:hypothetical protein
VIAYGTRTPCSSCIRGNRSTTHPDERPRPGGQGNWSTAARSSPRLIDDRGNHPVRNFTMTSTSRA